MTYFSFFQPFSSNQDRFFLFFLSLSVSGTQGECAPLFPNVTPDNILFESDRKKRAAGINVILSALKRGNEVDRKFCVSEDGNQ